MTNSDIGEYVARKWCAMHGEVQEGTTCPECGQLLLTKGQYRASDRHGSMPRDL
jgi:hypothetical protein